VRVVVYSTKPHDRAMLEGAAGAGRHRFRFTDARLSRATVGYAAAEQAEAVCLFVNDDGSAAVLQALADAGVRLVLLRCAGYNNVDLAAAAAAGLTVARVPRYSPHAVAEHSVALMLALDRKIHRAYNRVREGNFAIDGLLGFDLHGKSVGIVGMGAIGEALARILLGFGCRVLGVDPVPRAACEALGVRYVSFEAMLGAADIISLNCPLTPDSVHLIDAAAFDRMRDGVMLINTSRGAVVDTRAAIAALKRGRLGYLGLDVYEEESELFYEDRSAGIISDDVFARLLTFPNVIVTSHQGFFTREALDGIAAATLANLDAFELTGAPAHPIAAPGRG
jgi:D-lactate dehydrogenase